jgi:hypothetical protein
LSVYVAPREGAQDKQSNMANLTEIILDRCE